MNPILFALLAIAFMTGVMIVLQAIVRKAVWGVYIIVFFASVVGAAGMVFLR